MTMMCPITNKFWKCFANADKTKPLKEASKHAVKVI